MKKKTKLVLMGLLFLAALVVVWSSVRWIVFSNAEVPLYDEKIGYGEP